MSNFTEDEGSFDEKDSNDEDNSNSDSGASPDYQNFSLKRKAEVSEHVTTAKKTKTEWSNSYAGYSSAAVQMMKKMGYKEEEGLGKEGQGILTPIEASKQEGRRGFGLKLESLEAASEKWDPTTEVIELKETLVWLKNHDREFLDNLTMDDLDNWVVRGPEKLIIDDEANFCDPDILENILISKSVFDNLDGVNMRHARSRSNPFETIRGNIFLNRAAVKMANIDSICNFMFTNPVDENGKSLVKSDDLLYFADICAGPGGFSEYVFYRRKWEAKGFGFTLRGENDFKLSDFLAGPPETFDPYYGVKDNGDIYDPDNQESFAEYVLKQTDTGVHFVMADGGFSVKGQENIQEILSKQLYLCQCLVALSILREKGHFVCKMFDIFTPFSVGLIYLMYKCFEEIAICKPNTSRPANSERYLICKWKKANTETIRRHFSTINEQIFKHDPNNDILHLVDINILKQDEEFFNYIFESNNRIGKNQIVGLIKIAAFYNNKSLKEEQQAEYKKACLELWKLPDQMRKTPDLDPFNEILLEELLKEWKSDKQMLSAEPIKLANIKDLEKNIHRAVYDWYFVPIDRKDDTIRTFFLSKGKSNILRWNRGRWDAIDCHLEISPKTLFYGEITTELIGEGRSQKQVKSLHIIDGIVLGGIHIHRKPLKERIQMCTKFAKALNKPQKTIDVGGNFIQVAPIRCKKLFDLKDFKKFFTLMRYYKLKDGASRLGFRIRSDDPQSERFFVPGGLMFFNETNYPYVRALSKTYNKFYYHNSENNEAIFVDNLPNEIRVAVVASFRRSFYGRLIWTWSYINQVKENVDEAEREPNCLYRDDVNNYISKFALDKLPQD